MTYNTPLEGKVAAQNRVNQLAMDCYAKAIEPLKQFVGQKILKVDGSLLEKVKKALPELPVLQCNRIFYTCQHGYNLRIAIDESIYAMRRSGVGGTYYVEASAYLCNIRDGVLTELYPKPELRTDYTHEEILMARKDLETAKAAMSLAQSRLQGFGEYDN